MVFRKLGGEVFTIQQIAKAYPIVPAGTLTYYGVVESNARAFRESGSALQPSHRRVLEHLISWLQDGAGDRVRFELVIEPLEPEDPYRFVADNLDLMQALALELSQYQDRAERFGRRLDVTVRYASEMNDAGNGYKYSGRPAAFKESFALVRRTFAASAPQIRFSFAPALRADLDTSAIAPYWPGDDLVDIVGATWFVHGERQKARAFENFRAYFLEFRPASKPFAIDEFGGAEGRGAEYCDNDAMLAKMLEVVDSLRFDGVAFEYGTILLDDRKYGVDATLDGL